MLVVLFLTHPEQITWVSVTSASEVNLNLRPPSWLGWMKLFLTTWNWSLSVMTFSISFPKVFRRTMGQKDLGLSYACLFGFGMMMVEDCLKWLSQCPKLIHMSAILMMWTRHASCFRMVLRWCYVSLSGPRAEELLHLMRACWNSSFEKGTQVEMGLDPILLRTSLSIWWWRAELKVAWRASQRHLVVIHRLSSYLIALVAVSLHLLIQFINSHGPQLLFATSQI